MHASPAGAPPAGHTRGCTAGVIKVVDKRTDVRLSVIRQRTTATLIEVFRGVVYTIMLLSLFFTSIVYCTYLTRSSLGSRSF